MTAPYRPAASLSPERLARRRELDRIRTARRRARLEGDRRSRLDATARSRATEPDAAQLADPRARIIYGGAGSAWRGRHALRMAPSRAQRDTIAARLDGRPWSDAVEAAHAARRALARSAPRRRGEATWLIWRAVLSAIDAALAALRRGATWAPIPAPGPAPAILEPLEELELEPPGAGPGMLRAAMLAIGWSPRRG